MHLRAVVAVDGMYGRLQAFMGICKHVREFTRIYGHLQACIRGYFQEFARTAGTDGLHKIEKVISIDLSEVIQMFAFIDI